MLLDVNLPELDGLEALKELRLRGGIPVIVVTARGEDLYKLPDLKLGADDYVVKPFNPNEVVVRVGAALCRSRLVDDLRTLSLADADQLHLSLAPLELCSFVQEQVWGFAGRAVQRGIKLEYHCSERTLFRQADRQWLSQVLYNLLENAVRYTPARTGSIGPHRPR